MGKDVILITGSSSDIGREIIKAVSRKDTAIIAHYNSSKESLLRSALPGRIIPVKADFTVLSDVKSLIGFVKKRYGCPDKIIHLPAAPLKQARFKDLSWGDFSADIDIQLRSAVLLLKEFLPPMAERGSGKVVFILSSCTLGMPPKFISHYNTVKYAMLGLARSLAAEYAGRGMNINAISPSMVETKFLSGIMKKVVELAAENNPMKRNAAVKDVVPLVEFLLSERSAYISGANIPVTGGSVF